jgi:hypothetical protein
MAMVTVIWATAAEVIITDGAGDTVITTAGHAVIIATATTDSPAGGRFRRFPATRLAKVSAMLRLMGYMLAIVVTLAPISPDCTGLSVLQTRGSLMPEFRQATRSSLPSGSEHRA